MKWEPREIKDLDKAPKFSQKKRCPRHGIFYGVFCLKCKLAGLSGQDQVEVDEQVNAVG